MSEAMFKGCVDQTEVELFNMDCVKGMTDHVGDGSVDVVVTSPPYNIGTRYKGYDDTVAREKYLSWTADWTAQVKRVLADEGSFFLNIAGKPSDPSLPFQVVPIVTEEFVLQNVIHWVKSIAIDKKDVGSYPGIECDVAVGHYKPINSSRFVNCVQEYVFHLTKTGEVPLDRLAIGVPYQDAANARRWASGGAGLRCRGNVWFIPYKTVMQQKPHPAAFPLELPIKCIKLHGLERCNCVLDPLAGVGTTVVAATKLGVKRAYGFDIENDYLDHAWRWMNGNEQCTDEKAS